MEKDEVGRLYEGLKELEEFAEALEEQKNRIKTLMVKEIELAAEISADLEKKGIRLGPEDILPKLDDVLRKLWERWNREYF